MKLDRYISQNRVIDLKGNDLESALLELLNAIAASRPQFGKRTLLKQFLQRGSAMTTYLGNGVILPHTRAPIPTRFLFAVGRSRKGIDYKDIPDGHRIHLVFVFLGSEREKAYLRALASVARIFRDGGFVDGLVSPPRHEDFRERLLAGISEARAQSGGKRSKFNRLIFRQTERVAREAGAAAVLLFADTFYRRFDEIPRFDGIPTVLISSNHLENTAEAKGFPSLHIQAYSNKRFAQLRSAVLVGLGRGMFNFSDRICCVGGIAESNQFDSMVMIDIRREFQSVLSDRGKILPGNVKPAVLERVLAIATELTVEGREGQRIGTLFVVGDSEKVETMTKPMVLNPFHGYEYEDRNILNPFMDETIKEFSQIDGAFIIRGDGVILSAGTLIHVPEYEHKLPSGLGSRHAAAYAISEATQCVSVVLSNSTGNVTLFRKGVMLPIIENTVSGSF